MTEIVLEDKHIDVAVEVCQDPAAIAMFRLAKKVAASHASILISGETGSGKEILANYIHANSLVSNGPFVSLNCAALPDNMIESILFGYEKGSFTGAINTYIGKFEQANHGTLFLDEIAEIPLHLQAKLLRVLQENKVERLGGKQLMPIQVRIIAASNKNLSQQVKNGLFRADLYFRLNVVPVECKPLRERRGDIIALAEYFLKRFAKQMNQTVPQLSAGAKQKLLNACWPGNIREMENVLHRAFILKNSHLITEDDLIIETEVNFNHSVSKLKETETDIILKTLQEEQGKRSDTAKKLRMSPRTLRYKLAKLKQLGISVPGQGDQHDN